LQPLVKTLEHAARLFAGFARAFHGHVIAALVGHHAKPALDQGEVLPVLPEQRGREFIVVEGENESALCRLFGGDAAGGITGSGVRKAPALKLLLCEGG
jgi:hypothetical protein